MRSLKQLSPLTKVVLVVVFVASIGLSTLFGFNAGRYSVSGDQSSVQRPVPTDTQSADCTTLSIGWQWGWIGYGAAQPTGMTKTNPNSYAGYCISSLPFAPGTYTPDQPGILAVTYDIQGIGVSSYAVVMLYASPQVVVQPLNGNGTTVASIRPTTVNLLTPLSQHNQAAISGLFTIAGVVNPIVVGDSSEFGLPCSYSDIQDAVMGARALNHC